MTHAPTTQVRVLYHDTDQMGVVNNVQYLRYFEIGRAEWIRNRGKSYKAIEAEGCRLPVVEAHLRYKEPARYDDVLDIHTNVQKVRAVTLTFEYAIRRSADGALLCEGYTKHCCLDAENKLIRFPEALLALLRPLPR
jgi:acyl-CoA thioester hydrolase